MELNERDIQEFKEAYRQDTGEVLSDAKALDLATRYSTMMDVVYRPLKKLKKDE